MQRSTARYLPTLRLISFSLLCLPVWTSKAYAAAPFTAPLLPQELPTAAVVDARSGQTPHWAFVGPVRPPLPPVDHQNWPRNEIDLFVLGRLERPGLRPSPEADRITLIRRVTLDLTGLPPAPEEVDAFLQDPAPDSFERVVDRLLASPRYGEHMARDWLDQ